jgi:amino acid transporter
MMYFTMQALAELGVLYVLINPKFAARFVLTVSIRYPVNGAFFSYNCRFISLSWGFATGWDYAIQWLTVLPFEITAAGITLDYWKGARDINQGVWITVFLVALIIVQIFGVRGYGEVEFVLSIIKIIACTGFIILAIIINCGGVPTDHRGYIGGRYWHAPEQAFRNGFQGFCSVFVTAAFAFAGTELTGLAAAEAANPLKSIPLATKQVLWRITFFYVVNLLLIGLIVPASNKHLLGASGANTKDSPFVLAIQLAGIKGLPSVFNAVITISVLSVANSCTFGSTRTMQALAAHGMGPKFLAYVDKHGRPIWCVLIQILFGFLAFVVEAGDSGFTFFYWLLALSGVANFFIWGSICFAHIRFRAGWVASGRTLDEIPYRAQAGIIGSYCGVALCLLCIMASFYTALYPVGAQPTAYVFFQDYLAAPLIGFLYLAHKLWTRDWQMFIPASKMDVTTGMRMNIEELQEMARAARQEKTWANLPMRIVRGLF